MVILSPQDLGLWDPFQMAFLWLINGGDYSYLLSGVTLQAVTIITVDGRNPQQQPGMYKP